MSAAGARNSTSAGLALKWPHGEVGHILSRDSPPHYALVSEEREKDQDQPALRHEAITAVPLSSGKQRLPWMRSRPSTSLGARLIVSIPKPSILNLEAVL